jgi:AMP-polyphosphate phosphotransferase
MVKTFNAGVILVLEKIDLKIKMSKKDYEKSFDDLAIKVGALQRSIRDAEIPVVIVFEGFRGALRGELINKLLSVMDPRGFRVYSTSKTTDAQRTKPFFTAFWQQLPTKGAISLYHRGWYFLKNEHDVGDPDEASVWYDVDYEQINTFERELTEEKYCIVKIFAHLSEKKQEKNLKKIAKIYGNSWENLAPGGVEGIDYKAYHKVYEKMLAITDTVYAPWHVVPLEDMRVGVISVFNVIIDSFERALRRNKQAITGSLSIRKDSSVPDILSTFDLTKTVSKSDYEVKLKEHQKKLKILQYELYKKKISAIVGFEGWDAGGKGGVIKRFTSALDPLGYAVNPIGAPNDWEESFHYLWRFWQHIPNVGEAAIFDRTWYGRVLVERVEHFATVDEWSRAYTEINDMEAQWDRQGIIVQKFWLQIDKDEQYKRFEAREKDPGKTWKITPDDWRNRDKWSAYVDAVDEMLYRTDTKAAPWTVVEANCKYYARLKVLETMIARYEKVLK